MSLNNLPQIVQLASNQIGQHYLWGGRGEIPGFGTSCSLPGRKLRMVPDSFDPHAPMVRTALHPLFNPPVPAAGATNRAGVRSTRATRI